MKVIVAIIAISSKKSQGWIKFVPVNGRSSWNDMGAHFDKERYERSFVSPGIYELELQDTADFGERPKYTVGGVELLQEFTDFVKG